MWVWVTSSLITLAAAIYGQMREWTPWEQTAKDGQDYSRAVAEKWQRQLLQYFETSQVQEEWLPVYRYSQSVTVFLSAH